MRIFILYLICFFVAPFLSRSQENTRQSFTEVFSTFSDTSASSPITPYRVLRTGNPLKSGSFVRQLSQDIYIIDIRTQDHANATGIAVANNKWKLSPALYRENNFSPGNYFISCIDVDDCRSFLTGIRDLSIVKYDEPSQTFEVKVISPAVINYLLSYPGVLFIDRKQPVKTEAHIIGYNRSFHGINALDYSIPGANGKNITVGVKERKMDEADIDLYRRVLASPLASAITTSHANVISSIIGGAGNTFYDGRGQAYASRFFSSNFDNPFADDLTILNANKVTIQNHAYGTVVQQFYGAEALSYDAQAWTNRNIVHVFSSGNRGNVSASEGRFANIPGFANLTGNFKMAKNVITVAAIDNNGNIPAESSAGPLYDGRLGPQITALGPNGTSDAAAVVSGTIAVMQQVYADSNAQSIPPAALVKSIIYNNADDVLHKGIDYKTGYGLMNSFQCVKAIQSRSYESGTVTQGQQWIRTVSVPPNTARLKVTLSWTDTASTVNNFKALVNDLDLEVFYTNAGQTFQPWVLSSFAHVDSLLKEPVRKRDSLNTSEQVSIELPASGNYEIRVKGFDISNGPIPFSVSWKTDTLNTFKFLSPQHTSDVNRVENPEMFVRWSAHVADTNETGNLSISYDRGLNWQPVENSYKIYRNQYRWMVKDTSSTSVFRMQTSFGTFYSNEFIISKVIRPEVDFLCTDSFRLSWDKHIYASGYQIYSLTNDPYLQPLITVSDTFFVFNRVANPSMVYAVEPITSNGIAASRSMAVDITTQGVRCFYKTFYYNLLDRNSIELVVELGGTAYIDSVFFEQVSATGQLLEEKGSQKVMTAIDLYRNLVNNAPAGNSYWRVKIRLKSGAVVYTEIISILTTGEQYIRFYPNPVTRSQTMDYILQQGFGSDCSLRIFDNSGRMIRNYFDMPNGVDVSNMVPGLYIFKLFDNTGRLLQTGKFAVVK